MIALSLLLCTVVSRGQSSRPTLPDREVTVLLTAIDKTQNLIEIQAADLIVNEDGHPTQITSLQQVKDSAVTIALIIDISISQERTLDAQKTAATSFVNSIIRPDRDQAAVATLTNALHVEQQPTNDLPLLRSAIARAQIALPKGYQGGGIVVGPPPTSRGTPAALIGSSAIWDAVMVTCDRWQFSSGVTTRRAIVLLTDGQDTSSVTKPTQAAECADQKNIAVYSIGIGDEKYDGVNKTGLQKLSEATGGQAYFPKKTTDLSAVFDQIGRSLRNYYVLSYKSIGTKPVRKVKIGVANPGLKGIQLFYGQMVSN